MAGVNIHTHLVINGKCYCHIKHVDKVKQSDDIYDVTCIKCKRQLRRENKKKYATDFDKLARRLYNLWSDGGMRPIPALAKHTGLPLHICNRCIDYAFKNKINLKSKK